MAIVASPQSQRTGPVCSRRLPPMKTLYADRDGGAGVHASGPARRRHSAKATTHLDTLKICMNNCDTIYQPLGDQGHFEEMLRGANNCRKSLNNLYFASVGQTITDQLNQETRQKQTGEKQSAFELLSATMLMKQQAQQPQAHPAVDDAQPVDDDAPTHTNAPAPPANPQPSPGFSDNINW